jgi:TusE/DsrC/DsvC family sulfur relay protein
MTLEQNNLNLDLDREGYLINFEDWNENVACELADKEGISRECPLTQERMEILKFMRDYHYQQFPDPIIAWKIAGLPKPTPEVLAKIKHNV